MLQKMNALTIVKMLLALILSTIIVLAVIIAFSNVKPDQNLEWFEGASIERNLDSETYGLKFDSLTEEFGHQKTLLEGYELQCLIALSKYPELKDVKISFEFAPISAPLESNFDFMTLIKNGKNRRYRILISNDTTSFFKEALIGNMNFDTQVALLTHELGHTVYYHQLNLFQIGRWAINYLASKKFRAKHERDTDRMVIHKGLGWQQFESASFFYQMFNDGKLDIDLETVTEGMGNYLSPSEIILEMKALESYKSSVQIFEQQLGN